MGGQWLLTKVRAGPNIAAWAARISVTAATVALWSLGACSNPSDKTVQPINTVAPTNVPTSAQTASAVPQRATPTTVPAPDGLRRGGTLRFAVAESPPHLDPHQTVSPALLTWGPGIAYSRVFRFVTGPDVTSPDGELVCDLCSSWRQPDPTTIHITIRNDARWQLVAPVGRRLVTAYDVVYSLNRLATPGWPSASLMANVLSVTAPDNETMEVKLKSPDAEALENLADSHARIVSEIAVAEKGNLLRGPTVGSGPWVVSSFETGFATYDANNDYYEEDFPYLDRIETQVMPDPATRLAVVQTKIFDMNQAPFRDIKEAFGTTPGLTYLRTPEHGAGVFTMVNARRPWLDDPEVRKSLLLAWDPWAIVSDTWDGEATVGLGLPVSHHSWLLSDLELGAAFAMPEIARSTLTAATSDPKAPRSVVITAGEYGDLYIATAEALAAQLSAVGVPATVTRVSTRDYADRVWASGDYDVLVGPQPPFASLSAYLMSTIHSKGAANPAGARSDTLDALIEAQRTELSYDSRRENVLEIQRQMLVNADRFAVAGRVSHWVYWPYVHGLSPNMFRGESHWLTQIWLDK